MTGTTKKSMDVSSDTALILARLDTLEEGQKDIVKLLRGDGDNLGIVAQVKVNTGKLDDIEEAMSCVEDHVHVSVTEHNMLTKHDRILFGDNGNIKAGLISRFESLEKAFSIQNKVAIMVAVGIGNIIGGAIVVVITRVIQ
jgi:hypothetical protein